MASSSSSIKFVAEYAKSNRSACKKCAITINNSVLRLGSATRDPRGFEYTKWYHLHCFPLSSNPLSSADSIKGFSMLKIFIACGFNFAQQVDPFRKPKPGMWHIMAQQFNSGVQIDMDQPFYVGDVAGRPNDQSDADIKFAQAIGLEF